MPGSIDLYEIVADGRDWKDRFREAVLARHGRRCFVTGRTDVPLDTHHLFNVAHHPRLRRFVSNGRPMDRALHRRFHREHGDCCTPYDVILWCRNADPDFNFGGTIILPYHLDRWRWRKRRR